MICELRLRLARRREARQRRMAAADSAKKLHEEFKLDCHRKIESLRWLPTLMGPRAVRRAAPPPPPPPPLGRLGLGPKQEAALSNHDYVEECLTFWHKLWSCWQPKSLHLFYKLSSWVGRQLCLDTIRWKSFWSFRSFRCILVFTRYFFNFHTIPEWIFQEHSMKMFDNTNAH